MNPDTQDFNIRPELYLFVRASESMMDHDSSLKCDVLLTYVKTLADRYLALANNPARQRDS